MTINDSSTGGIISPETTLPAPHEDDSLDDDIQLLVSAISGLPGQYVRPRWQVNPPKEPAIDVNWCAIGITNQEPEDPPIILHKSEGDGYDQMLRYEIITALASFYGPNAKNGAALLRDGLYVAQNRDELRAKSLWLLDVGSIVMAPDLVNLNWRHRADLQFRLKREIIRNYPVKNLVSAQGTVVPGNGVTRPWKVEP